ncbi:MAG: 2Fe-2S iron-sulfur cluster-binding protein [Bacteroidota bacterium]
MFYALIVDKIKRETSDCVSIHFQVPSDLKEVFVYKAGQYLTLKVEIEGKEERRSYSICSAPYEGSLIIAAKKIPNGLVSTFLNEKLNEGDSLDVMAPNGNFTIETENRKKTHVAFAAGSGITPIISIAKQVLKDEVKSEFHLYFGNKTSDSIIFKEELLALEKENKKLFGKRFKVNHYLSQESAKEGFYGGRIDETVLREAIRKHLRADHFYFCGPEEMILKGREILLSKAIPENQIHFELFTTSGSADTIQNKSGEQPNTQTQKTKVKIILDEQETEFEMNAKDSVLHAAIDRGLDVPYACQGGTCCTCQAKLEEGEVHMDLNMVLSDEEVQNGMILTCQSHPKSENIVVNYDNT